MLFVTLLITWATFPAAATTADMLADPFALYASVAEHIRAHPPMRPENRLMLDGKPFSTHGHTLAPHRAELVRELQTGGWIDTECGRTHGSPQCVAKNNNAVVRLSPILELPEDSRVVPNRSATADSEGEMSDVGEEPVDLAVDVVLHTPCSAPPSAEKCQLPNIVQFRYFFREKADGTYQVVTRWLTGAV